MSSGEENEQDEDVSEFDSKHKCLVGTSEAFRPLMIVCDFLFLFLALFFIVFGLVLRFQLSKLIDSYVPRVTKEYLLTNPKVVNKDLEPYLIAVLTYFHDPVSYILIGAGALIFVYNVMALQGLIQIDICALMWYSLFLDFHFYSMIGFTIFLVFKSSFPAKLLGKCMTRTKSVANQNSNFAKYYAKAESFVHNKLSCSQPEDCAKALIDKGGKWYYLAPCIACIGILTFYVILMAIINTRYQILDPDREDDDDDDDEDEDDD
ncbi:hypothetical protein Ciccas_000095 [Cichlidogyrus casuarinus]|uniref:Uncharacterized protein n=1 Tax=Cichlidogyrus casuarinus TaxID=1844966 RepID=A0ABD2QQ11_9PLAT